VDYHDPTKQKIQGFIEYTFYEYDKLERRYLSAVNIGPLEFDAYSLGTRDIAISSRIVSWNIK